MSEKVYCYDCNVEIISVNDSNLLEGLVPEGLEVYLCDDCLISDMG